MRYIDCKLSAVKLFEEAGIADAAIDAEYLLLEAAGMSRSRFFMEQFEEVPPAVKETFEAYVERRAKHEPLQYILGCQEFMGLDFKCSKEVLIPRQDTEVLVEETLKVVEKLNLVRKQDTYSDSVAPIRYVDICTGSGCIPISVFKLSQQKYGLELDCSATDISDFALSLAKENAARLEADVKIYKSDMWQNIEGQYDIITSNPPYIETDIIDGLMPEVAEFEPRLALDGGADGLIFYRKLVERAKEFLKKNGWLLMEIGDTQGFAVSELMRLADFRDIRVVKDLAGLDRVVLGHI